MQTSHYHYAICTQLLYNSYYEYIVSLAITRALLLSRNLSLSCLWHTHFVRDYFEAAKNTPAPTIQKRLYALANGRWSAGSMSISAPSARTSYFSGSTSILGVA